MRPEKYDQGKIQIEKGMEKMMKKSHKKEIGRSSRTENIRTNQTKTILKNTYYQTT